MPEMKKKAVSKFRQHEVDTHCQRSRAHLMEADCSTPCINSGTGQFQDAIDGNGRIMCRFTSDRIFGLIVMY